MIGANSSFQHEAEAAGLEFACVGPDLSRTWLRNLTFAAAEVRDPHQQLRFFVSSFGAFEEDLVTGLSRLCQQSDLLIASKYLGIGAPEKAAAATQIPWVQLDISRWSLLASLSHPSEVISDTFRDLEPQDYPPLHTFIASSPALTGDNLGSGFFTRRRTVPNPLSLNSTNSVRNGSPPIAVSFGSMLLPNAGYILQSILDASSRSGIRVIIQRGSWLSQALISARKPSSNVLYVGPMPHASLFAKCAAVIHHGGGCLVEATRQGLPQIHSPFCATTSTGLGILSG